MKINPYKLNDLPFDVTKFKQLSEDSFYVHHKKHHAGYVNKLVQLNEKHNLGDDLFKIMKISYKKTDADAFVIYNNAAQHWNHEFFWNSFHHEKNEVAKKLLKLIEKSFGSYSAFEKEFYDKGAALFGSGWVWLVYEKKEEKLQIITTGNALNPMVLDNNCYALLVCDVWEHAYYIDYLNKRVDYLKVIIDSFNWKFAQKRLDEIL